MHPVTRGVTFLSIANVSGRRRAMSSTYSFLRFAVVEHLKILRQRLSRGFGRRAQRLGIGQFRRGGGGGSFLFLCRRLDDLQQTYDGGVDLGFGVVKRQRDSAGAGNVHATHERLAAMMAGADGDAVAIELHADIDGRHGRVLQHEGDDARLLRGGADDAQCRESRTSCPVA